MVNLKTMNVFLYLTIILSNIGGVINDELYVLKGHICKNDVCVKENPLNSNEKQISQDFVYKNSPKSLVKIKYLNKNSENFVSYANNDEKFLGESEISSKLQSPITLENKLIEYTDNETDFSSTEVTETVTEFTFLGKDVPKTTTDFSGGEKTSVIKPKLNPSTTELPSSTPQIFVQHLDQKNTICFCDLTLNVCDVNCCCDVDCSLSHFKVFTKCSDDAFEYDTNYCYKSNFIFQNNTSHKVVQNKGGLFCIVKDNLEISLNYLTRPIITTLEAFNKSLSRNVYAFSYKSLNKSEFTSNDYQAGAPLWIVQDGEIKQLGIPAPSMGLQCLSQLTVKYLIDKVTVCAHQKHPPECGKSKGRSVFDLLRDMKIISSPSFINKSNILDSSKICQEKTCIGVIIHVCQYSGDISTCIKVQEKGKNFPKLSCWNTVNKIQYLIWHNGSTGITKFDAYIWLRNSSEDQYLQTTEVKFLWWDSSDNIFKRSGNPGYLPGKPILAGRKVYYTVNETSEKKEAIELSLDSRNWLSVVRSEKGLCSSKFRTPVNFRENSQFMCSIKLTKDNFGKEKCSELQNDIFKVLIGDEIINATKDNYFNKFVATFGNSQVEETGDWVQVLIDLFPVTSGQTGFRSNYYHLICKNIVTDLFIDVAYSNIGSFLNPQAKILGVSYRLGKHKDLIFYCDTPDCEGQSTAQYFKLSSAVRFVDLTKPAVDAFAEPLTLEVRLPHDFFYPFFSKGFQIVPLSMLVFVFSLSALL